MEEANKKVELDEKKLNKILSNCTPHQIVQLCDLLRIEYRLFEEYYVNHLKLYDACVKYGACQKVYGKRLSNERKKILNALNDPFYRRKIIKILRLDCE